jgi:hypothetical protein
MDRIDRIFKVEPETVGERKVIYDRWRHGFRYATIGAIALVGGAATNLIFGIGEGFDVELAGLIVAFYGGERVAFNLGGLRSYS